MTPKQEKLINIISENFGNKNSTKTLGEMLLEAGYTKETSENACKILESETIQEGIKPVVNQLEAIRAKALNALEKKDPSREQFRELTSVIDVLTKNIQLLSDKPTDINKNQEVELLRLELKEWMKSKEN
jgi:hypothetical protein